MKDLYAIFSFVKPYIRKRWLQFFIVSFLGLSNHLVYIAIPFLQGTFINSLSADSTTAFLITFALLYFVSKIIQIAIGYFFRTVGQSFYTHVGFNIMKDIVFNIQDASLSVSSVEAKAEVANKINSDSSMLGIFVINFIMNFFGNILDFAVPVIYLATVNMYFCIAAILVIPIYVLTGRILKGAMFRTQKASMYTRDVVQAKLLSQFFDTKFIKLNNLGKRLIDKLFQAKMNNLNAFIDEFRIEAVSGSVKELMTAIMQAGLFIFGGLMIIRGEMAIGTFVIISSYFGTIVSAAGFFLTIQSDIQGAKAYLERLTDLKKWETETNGDKIVTDINRIDVKNLSFSYGKTKVIERMNLCFEKGKIYSVLGGNGAGKSTLSNLLLGLYIDEFEGEVLYDNTSIREIDMKATRGSLIGVTQQEPPLLNETIRFNILFNDDNKARDGEIYALAEMLGLSEYLDGLENGLDTVISESASNLSGGQKQKISILRSLLKNPKLMILDEPSSALDTASKQMFVDYLKTIKNEKIIVVITHDQDFLEITDSTVRL